MPKVCFYAFMVGFVTSSLAALVTFSPWCVPFMFVTGVGLCVTGEFYLDQQP